jgi:hypothetical protein
MENLEEKEATFLTEKDIDQIVSSLSDDIIFDSLTEQVRKVFDTVDSSPVFYLTYFTSKYDFLINKYSEYNELCDKIKDVRQSFFFKLKELIEEKFDFTVDFGDSLTEEEQFLYISHIYNFFVIRNRENCVNIINNYIERESKELIRQYKTLIDKKDLTYMNMKKSINKDVAVIICKLPDIIQAINVENAKDIIELAMEDKHELTNLMIQDVLLNDAYTTYGENFINNVLNHLKNNEIYYLLTRTDLVNKYNIKK